MVKAAGHSDREGPGSIPGAVKQDQDFRFGRKQIYITAVYNRGVELKSVSNIHIDSYRIIA